MLNRENTDDFFFLFFFKLFLARFGSGLGGDISLDGVSYFNWNSREPSQWPATRGVVFPGNKNPFERYKNNFPPGEP